METHNKIGYFVIRLFQDDPGFQIRTFKHNHFDVDECKDISSWLYDVNFISNPIYVTFKSFALYPLFNIIKKSHFKRPSNKNNKWVIISSSLKHDDRRNRGGGLLITQYNKKIRCFCAIPICDVHKIPNDLLYHTSSGPFNIYGEDIDGGDFDLEYILYKYTKDETVLRNHYVKTITLFEIMIEKIELEETNFNKKQRFQ